MTYSLFFYFEDILVPSDNTREQTVPGWGVLQSCSVTVNGNVVIIGGYFDRRQVIERLGPNSWDSDTWQQLPGDRWGHSCTLLDTNIVIAGGTSDWSNYLSSTMIMNTLTKKITTSGDMTTPRAWFVMAALEGIIFAIGGQRLSSVEKFNTENGDWEETSDNIVTARNSMGSTTVSASVLGCT